MRVRTALLAIMVLAWLLLTVLLAVNVLGLRNDLAGLHPRLARMEGELRRLRAPERTEGPSLPPAGGGALAAAQEQFAAIAHKVGPTVVSIQGGTGPWSMPFSEGSGTIVDGDGYIVTNRHVVHGARRIRVRLDDGRILKGRICGTDDRSDLAVVKVDAGEPLPVIEFSDQEAVRVGQWAIALGNPFRLYSSITVGIVSGVRHNTDEQLGHLLVRPGDDVPFYGGLVQTDAALNPGNSGGPLVDIEGKLIGVNVSILSKTGRSAGVGFAIPVATLRHHLAFLQEGKPVPYGFLGLGLGATGAEERSRLKRAGLRGGALVTAVVKDGPAHTAGLRPGMVVIAFGGRPTPGAGELISLASLTAVGEEVRCEVLDGDERREFPVRVALRPAPDKPRLPIERDAPPPPASPSEEP